LAFFIFVIYKSIPPNLPFHSFHDSNIGFSVICLTNTIRPFAHNLFCTENLINLIV
jgi:hypothetical protein